jgi:hypothetical protein
MHMSVTVGQGDGIGGDGWKVRCPGLGQEMTIKVGESLEIGCLSV